MGPWTLVVNLGQCNAKVEVKLDGHSHRSSTKGMPGFLSGFYSFYLWIFKVFIILINCDKQNKSSCSSLQYLSPSKMFQYGYICITYPYIFWRHLSSHSEYFECLALFGWFCAKEWHQNQTLDHPQDPFGPVVKPKLSLMSLIELSLLQNTANWALTSLTAFNSVYTSLCMLVHPGRY